MLRSQRGGFELTGLGREAVEAQREFQENILSVAIPARVGRLKNRIGIDLISQTEQSLLENIRRTPGLVVPLVLDIMRLQSHFVRLSILLTLTSDQTTDFQSLRQRIASVTEEDVPASSLSNSITALERRDLLKREGKSKRPEIRLTELGQTSIEAYDRYQERLIPPLLAEEMAIIERDLGIMPK